MSFRFSVCLVGLVRTACPDFLYTLTKKKILTEISKLDNVQCRYGGETECLAYVTTADKWVPLANLPVGKVNATSCPTGLLERDRSIIIAGGRDINGRASRSGSLSEKF